MVKPNELVREEPYISHNLEMTRRAHGLDRFSQREFPAETTVDATDPANARQLFRTSGCGTGMPCRIRCVRRRRSELIRINEKLIYTHGYVVTMNPRQWVYGGRLGTSPGRANPRIEE
jgi:uncharacterized membrane protein (UPF0182 family)